MILQNAVFRNIEEGLKDPTTRFFTMTCSKQTLPIVTIGLDACKGGWVVIREDAVSSRRKNLEIEMISNLQELALEEKFSYHIGIDIPIGILDHAEKGGRYCDRKARSILKWPRSSTVFSPPVRPALSSSSYEEALRINKSSSSAQIGLSIQAYHIIPRIVDADEFARYHKGSSRVRVFEVHPELSFLEMAGMTLESKHTKEGLQQRQKLLAKKGFDNEIFESFLAQNKMVKENDILDAAAVLWSVNRISRDSHQSTGVKMENKDSQGLTMRIHW